MNAQKIELSLNLVNGVLQYLGTRPYQETYQLIQAIQEQAIPQMPVPASAQAPTDVVSVE
jgi:hypothetical protein